MPSYRGTALGAMVATSLFLPLSGTASAQAWVPPKGEAVVSLGWSRNWADHHLDYLGAFASPGDMIWNNAVSDLGYGVTDRLAVRVNIPFVISKYVGTRPHPARPGKPPLDDGSWHSTFQDFRAEVRFRATTGSLAVTPVVALLVPSHWYESHGHSAFGKNQIEGQFGINVGRVLDPVLPDAYLQARYVFAVTGKTLGISHNRSNVAFDLGYFVTGSLTVSAFGAWTKTHGGWRATIDFPPNTNPDFWYHDRLTKAEYVRIGGGASYAITGSIDVGVNAFATIWAESDVNMSGVGLTVSYGFSPSQMIKRKKGSPPKP